MQGMCRNSCNATKSLSVMYEVRLCVGEDFRAGRGCDHYFSCFDVLTTPYYLYLNFRALTFEA